MHGLVNPLQLLISYACLSSLAENPMEGVDDPESFEAVVKANGPDFLWGCSQSDCLLVRQVLTYEIEHVWWQITQLQWFLWFFWYFLFHYYWLPPGLVIIIFHWIELISKWFQWWHLVFSAFDEQTFAVIIFMQLLLSFTESFLGPLHLDSIVLSIFELRSLSWQDLAATCHNFIVVCVWICIVCALLNTIVGDGVRILSIACIVTV